MAMSEAKLLRDLGQLDDDADRLLRATQAAHRLAWNLPEAGAGRIFSGRAQRGGMQTPQQSWRPESEAAFRHRGSRTPGARRR